MITNQIKILKEIRNPLTVKAVQERTGLKWSNLSKHLSNLEREGYIVLLGKDGKSKVITSNKLKIKQFLDLKGVEIDKLRQELL